MAPAIGPPWSSLTTPVMLPRVLVTDWYWSDWASATGALERANGADYDHRSERPREAGREAGRAAGLEALHQPTSVLPLMTRP